MTDAESKTVDLVTAKLIGNYIWDNEETGYREFWRHGKLDSTRHRNRCNGVAHKEWGTYSEPQPVFYGHP